MAIVEQRHRDKVRDLGHTDPSIAQAIADAEERGKKEAQARHAPGVLKVAKILAQAETNALEVQDKTMQMLEILAGTVDMAITELEEGHSEVAKEILQGIFADLKRTGK